MKYVKSLEQDLIQKYMEVIPWPLVDIVIMSSPVSALHQPCIRESRPKMEYFNLITPERRPCTSPSRLQVDSVSAPLKK